ncbi:hypothetical protein B0H11DRAFT_1024992 [Mycena galericulata]|nr:hypothetical protein B0H11DRAFT_1024992 [Mycena galericulata]
MNAAQIQSQLNSSYYFDLISLTLLFYDYFLTLGWEVSRYWGSSFTWPTILFFANRYGTLLGNLPVVVQYFWSKNSTPQKALTCGQIPLVNGPLILITFTSRCQHLGSYHQYFIIATQIMVGAMLILRTYALYERNKRVLALMLTVTIGAVIVGLWSVITGKSRDTQDDLRLYLGCNLAISEAQGVSLASAWAGVAAFDCMIFLLTLFKVFSQRRTRGVDLLTVLLRDGSMYFGVMFMSNLSNILTLVLGSPYTRGIATTFTNIISSVMITRLMLNLRDPSLSHMSGRLSVSTTTAGNVAPYVGPGGSPVLDTDAMDIELADISRASPASPGGIGDVLNGADRV